MRDYIDTARESAGALLELLNDILDLSRIEAGRLRIEAASFRLRPLLDKTVKSLGIRAYEKGLELLYDVPDDVPDHLVGDALRVRQVLTNLVGNAIKYTHKGEIAVRVAVRSKTDREACLEFLVQDTGIGISPEDQQKLFVSFEQAEAAATWRHEGSGLGLSISSRLVELMGGRMWVESQLGKGSEFHFTLCIPLATDAGVGERDNQELLEAIRGVSALVVTENATSRLILEQTLVRWSMRAETASSVAEALTKIHTAVGRGQKFQVVIADAILPEIDGFTLANWVNRGSLAGPVILMLSAVERHTAAAQLPRSGGRLPGKARGPGRPARRGQQGLGNRRQYGCYRDGSFGRTDALTSSTDLTYSPCRGFAFQPEVDPLRSWTSRPQGRGGRQRDRGPGPDPTSGLRSGIDGCTNAGYGRA